MLRRGLFDAVAALDRKQIDHAPVDEPDWVRVAHIQRQIAGAGHRRTRLCGEAGQ